MNKGRVLVVDDEPEIVRAVSMRLMANGYEVITAADGNQATSIAIKERPAVIILDIGMPAGSGHVVAKRLRDSVTTCSIPIIYLTARTDLKDIKEAFGLGINKYITKPFKDDELILAVSELMAKV